MPIVHDLRAYNANNNVDRFYKIDVCQDLFKTWSVSLFYGRRGTKGTRRNLAFTCQEAAASYAQKILQSKLKFSKNRGCAYHRA